jgi:putative aldouronate transport system substrate-binding protein
MAQPTQFDGGWGIGITKSCKDPVRAIKFLDWLSSDEGQILNNWGIEGKHYDVVNGKRIMRPEIQAMKVNDANNFARKINAGYSLSVRYGDGVKDPTGNYYTTIYPEMILKNYSDLEKQVLKAYKVTYWSDLLPPAKDFTAKPWGRAWSIVVPQESILSQHWNKEQGIVRKRIPEAILAKPADFDRLYDAFLAELHKTTGAMAEAETALVKDRLAQWYD